MVDLLLSLFNVDFIELESLVDFDLFGGDKFILNLGIEIGFLSRGIFLFIVFEWYWVS